MYKGTQIQKNQAVEHDRRNKSPDKLKELKIAEPMIGIVKYDTNILYVTAKRTNGFIPYSKKDASLSSCLSNITKRT